MPSPLKGEMPFALLSIKFMSKWTIVYLIQTKSLSSLLLQGDKVARVSVQHEDFDIGAEIARLKGTRTDVGAIVTFTGTVRDVEGTLESMTLEHYPGMTERELNNIAEEAERRWPLLGCRIIHRFGTLMPADNIVLVITLSAHRRAAFEAADFLMDFLKSRAPFWKKEDMGADTAWVDAKETDSQALKRWKS